MTGPPDPPAAGVVCLPVEGVGEVVAGADLAAELVTALGRDGLRDGDVLVVTSKVVSKSEGRLLRSDRDSALASETVRVVARRGATSIVRTRHGLTMAGAGIDASNTERGTVLLLPLDPDASARALRERITNLTARNVAVVVTDTAGRAWRHGQTDLAVGAAGVAVIHEYAGVHDAYGNELAVTAPAVADEMAAAADLVKGKLARRPAAVLRGLATWVLPAGRHGAGASALIREEHQDMFGYGAREAVLTAVAGDPATRPGFGRAAEAAEVQRALTGLGLVVTVTGTGAASGVGRHVEVHLEAADERSLGRAEARAEAAAFALGWAPVSPAGPRQDPSTVLRIAPATP